MLILQTIGKTYKQMDEEEAGQSITFGCECRT